MSKKKRNEASREGEAYTAKKKRKGNLLAFFLCFLIAFVIWLYASIAQDEKKNQEENLSTTALWAEFVANVGSGNL